MSVGAITLAFAPLLPWAAIALLGGACMLVIGLGILRRAKGLLWRTIACAILFAALTNPSVIEEQRSPQRDVAIVVVDESPSQRIGGRQQATETALDAIKDRLSRERDLEVRVIRAGKPQPGAGDDGTRLFTALDRAMSDVPRQRLAGIVMITDGQVHDVPAGDKVGLAEAVGVPLHVLLSGRPDEGDRRLVVNQAPSFGLVGKDLQRVKVVVNGLGAAGTACCQILLAAGVRDLIGCDRPGAVLKAAGAGLAEAQRDLRACIHFDRPFQSLHDALTGAYWRTYDFEAVPQNLTDRDLLLPDRRNLFAYPLGPGFGEATFRHAGLQI